MTKNRNNRKSTSTSPNLFDRLAQSQNDRRRVLERAGIALPLQSHPLSEEVENASRLNFGTLLTPSAQSELVDRANAVHQVIYGMDFNRYDAPHVQRFRDAISVTPTLDLAEEARAAAWYRLQRDIMAGRTEIPIEYIEALAEDYASVNTLWRNPVEEASLPPFKWYLKVRHCCMFDFPWLKGELTTGSIIVVSEKDTQKWVDLRPFITLKQIGVDNRQIDTIYKWLDGKNGVPQGIVNLPTLFNRHDELLSFTKIKDFFATRDHFFTYGYPVTSIELAPKTVTREFSRRKLRFREKNGGPINDSSV